MIAYCYEAHWSILLQSSEINVTTDENKSKIKSLTESESVAPQSNTGIMLSRGRNVFFEGGSRMAKPNTQ